jgi:hypothetical protein
MVVGNLCEQWQTIDDEEVHFTVLHNMSSDEYFEK